MGKQREENMTSLAVIGCGFVGSAVLDYFKYRVDVKVFDEPKELGSAEEVCQQDVLFVCLPTPQANDGSCDTSILTDVLMALNVEVAKLGRPPKPTIIKSTIPPGYCRSLQPKVQGLELIHSPEWLTARIAALDFSCSTRHILGRDFGVSSTVTDLYRQTFPGAQLLTCPWDVAALVKYFLNSFFACKITVLNEMHQIAEAVGVDPQDVLRLMKGDGRISRQHMEVPGPDGQFGFGGSCFPKDIAALISVAKEAGVDPKVLQATVAKNGEIRR